MYARGMTVREIQGYLLEMYCTEVSPEFISKVTDEVMDGPRSRVWRQAANRLHTEVALLYTLLTGDAAGRRLWTRP